jgi:hypothetical protein
MACDVASLPHAGSTMSGSVGLSQEIANRRDHGSDGNFGVCGQEIGEAMSRTDGEYPN